MKLRHVITLCLVLTGCLSQANLAQASLGHDRLTCQPTFAFMDPQGAGQAQCAYTDKNGATSVSPGALFFSGRFAANAPVTPPYLCASSKMVWDGNVSVDAGARGYVAQFSAHIEWAGGAVWYSPLASASVGAGTMTISHVVFADGTSGSGTTMAFGGHFDEFQCGVSELYIETATPFQLTG